MSRSSFVLAAGRLPWHLSVFYLYKNSDCFVVIGSSSRNGVVLEVLCMLEQPQMREWVKETVCNELPSLSAYKSGRATMRPTTDLTSQWAGEDAASWQLPSSLAPLLRPVFTHPASLVMMVAVVERRWQQQASWHPVGKAGWEGSQHGLSEACQGCQGAGCFSFFSARCCNREHTWIPIEKNVRM